MTDEKTDDIAWALWLGLLVIVVIAAIGGVMFLKQTELCERQFGAFNVKTMFSPLSGCMIQQPDGTWK